MPSVFKPLSVAPSLCSACMWSFAAALITQPTESGGDTARDPNAGRRECLQTELRKALAYDLNPE